MYHHNVFQPAQCVYHHNDFQPAQCVEHTGTPTVSSATFFLVPERSGTFRNVPERSTTREHTGAPTESTRVLPPPSPTLISHHHQLSSQCRSIDRRVCLPSIDRSTCLINHEVMDSIQWCCLQANLSRCYLWCTVSSVFCQRQFLGIVSNLVSKVANMWGAGRLLMSSLMSNVANLWAGSLLLSTLVSKAANTGAGRRTKHLDQWYHFARELVLKKQLLLRYCPMQDMIADMLMKPLAQVALERFRDMVLGTRRVALPPIPGQTKSAKDESRAIDVPND